MGWSKMLVARTLRSAVPFVAFVIVSAKLCSERIQATFFISLLLDVCLRGVKSIISVLSFVCDLFFIVSKKLFESVYMWKSSFRLNCGSMAISKEICSVCGWGCVRPRVVRRVTKGTQVTNAPVGEAKGCNLLQQQKCIYIHFPSGKSNFRIETSL